MVGEGGLGSLGSCTTCDDESSATSVPSGVLAAVPSTSLEGSEDGEAMTTAERCTEAEEVEADWEDDEGWGSFERDAGGTEVDVDGAGDEGDAKESSSERERWLNNSRGSSSIASMPTQNIILIKRSIQGKTSASRPRSSWLPRLPLNKLLPNLVTYSMIWRTAGSAGGTICPRLIRRCDCTAERAELLFRYSYNACRISVSIKEEIDEKTLTVAWRADGSLVRFARRNNAVRYANEEAPR